MDHEKWMEMAAEKTREGIGKGQTPFGACIVRDGEILALAHNRVWETTDITAHAEVVAIREACRTLGTIDLSGAVIYSTCEPCPMCYSAIHWARIRMIVFGASIADAEAAGFHELPVSNEMLRELSKGDMEIVPGCLRESCVDLFRLWRETGKSEKY